jgi:hypothetical protein
MHCWRTVIRFIGHNGDTIENSVQVPSLWVGEPDGDNDVPGVWRESYRCIPTLWKGPATECYGSSTKCPNDQDVHRASAQSQH